MPPELQQQAAEDNTMRGDISAAISSLESQSPPAAEPSAPAPAPSAQPSGAPAAAPPAQTVPTLRGEAPAQPAAGAGAPPLEKKPVPAAAEAPKPPAAEPTAEEKWASRLSKPPPSWKPQNHEHWAQIPPAARVEIHRRESETFKALTHAKEAREFVQKFNEVAQPYQMLIAQDGSPLKTFGEYLKTASILRMGTPHEKAFAIASAIAQFQVPIDLLDRALAGTLQGQAPAPGMGQQFRDPRVDELFTVLKQQEQVKEQQLMTEVDGELSNFANDPANTYYDYVRQDMGDLLELAARRGQKMSLQEAYRRCIMAHPEISKLVQQQEMVAATQKARAASVQVSGAPVVPQGVPVVADTVRGSIEAAIQQLSGR